MSDDRSSGIASLLKLAGERDQPSAEALERARAAARRSWQRGLDSDPGRRALDRATRRVFLGWSLLAAGIVAVAGIALWSGWTARPALAVARVAVVQGEVRLQDSGARVRVADVLRGDAVLATAEGRAALTVGDVLSLRLDRETRLRFEGPGDVTLLEGAVYVDSGGLNAHAPLSIRTPAGAVRHVGTQFLVRVDSRRTRVQVREGRVVLTRDGGAVLDLGAGDLADVSGARVSVAHGQPLFGAAWDWAVATAPAFDIENRPLSEFLAWLAREHGWQLHYADASIQLRAQDIRLHGVMAGLDARGMLERVTLVTGVPLTLDQGSLLVGKRP